MNINRIAELACLELPPGETEALTKDMERIEKMIGTLPELPDSDHERAATILREDEPHQDFSRGEMLRNAPQTKEGYVVIPETVV